MKLTKQLKAQILEVYNSYWNAYLKGDVRGITSLLDVDYTQVGSAETEVFSNKKAAVKFLNGTIDQVAGKLEMRNRTTRIELQGNLALVHEFCDVYVLAEGDWIFYSKFRASTLMQEKKHGWRIVHQHSSFPDARTGDGENIATQKIAAENQQLREAVKRRTIELEEKSRELEIEAALERVRAIAMGMKEPADMLEVCEAISLQMQSLGVKEIRNVQTAIFYESRGMYMNYEYYARHKKTIITETTYTNHKVHKAFATKMLKGKGEIFVTHIKDKKVRDWIAYQKTTNVFIDRYLEKASSLNYYWHSLGPVALGISTYVPLSKAELGLFKRFLDVFELAYTRYLHIEQAITQAREARIEAALERIRARAMAMHRSDELVEAADIVFQQLKALGIESIRTGIATFDAREETVTVWSRAHADSTKKILGVVPRKSHPFFVGCFDAWQAKEKFYSREFVGSEVAKYYRHMSSILSYPVLKTYNPKEVFYTFFFPEGSVNVIRHEKLTDDELGVMQRFARVFGLMYRRFLDLQKAEAQARESQIQLALERVRARTMAMQKSGELPDTSFVLFQQLKELGELAEQLSIGIVKEDEHIVELSATVHGSPLLKTFRIPIDEPFVMKSMVAAWRTGRKTLVLELRGRDLIGYNNWRNEFLGQQLFTYSGPDDCWIINVAFFSKGLLSFSSSKPHTEETFQLLERFAGVFDLTYTRFLDLQKAEAQAGESQIQLALERVRARTMAMQKSDELQDAAIVLFQQIKTLGIQTGSCGFNIWNKKEKTATVWMSSAEGGLQAPFDMPLTESPIYRPVAAAMKKGDDFLVKEVGGKNLVKHFNFLLTLPGIGGAIKHLRETGYVFPERMVYHFAFFNNGYLSFHTHEPHPEAHDIFKRFAKVFEQTYTRFLDLQKAEAQAREAHIEAALERVRSRSMGMQNSEELKEVIRVVYDQFVQLSINVEHTGFIMDYKARDDMHIWLADKHAVPFQVTIPYFDCAHWNSFNEAKKKGTDFFANHLSFEEKNKFYQELFRLFPVPDESKEYYFACPGLAISTVLLENVGLYIENFSGIPYTDEENHTLMRFGKVFQQTYTRFNDLQKAEEQAREAQIEAALERIRARAMGMHTSDELRDVAGILREQMGLLGQPELETSVIDLFEEGSDQVVSWYAFRPPGLSSGKIITGTASFPWASSELTREMMKVYRQRQQEHTMEAESSKAMELFRVLVQAAPEIGKYVTENIPDRVHYHLAYFSGGALLMVSFQPPSEEAKSLQRRAASVFDMAYRRYLDLKRAEAQAREAQIETAMERVRSKAMAMHTSADLSATVGAVFTELRKLGVNPIRAGVALYSHERRAPTFYATTSAENDTALAIKGSPDPSINPCLALQYEAWDKKQDYSPVLEGEELRAYYAALSLRPPVHADPHRPFQHKEYGYYLPFSEGNFYAWSEKPCTEDELNLLNRFKTIIDLTFRRYLDLQKAEAQTREAQIEASLERVRSRTLAMQKSDELAETAAVLFRQLITLGIEPNRLYIAIMKDEIGNAEFWITDEDGSKVSSGFAANLRDNSSLENMFAGWLEGKKSITIDMQGNELQEYFQYLSSLNVPFKGGLSQTRRIQNIAYFSRGFIGIASPEEQPEETTTLLERFAAVFNLTLTRFNDLKLAEAQAHQAHLDLIQLQTEKKRAEDALSELSATQAQLVQQEKLASLGQLTAGIAHEIKNPLNFVNNFSSVSVELLDEVVQEINTSAPELRNGDIPQLLGDIKINLTKIIEHGTRADGIVRSMLQHSRGGSGKKEPVDLNVLVKEYVNLAFHGMRASKNSINVDIVLDLDKSIGKVPVIAEDFSRVIINLCQNAFDAMREKCNAEEKKPGSYLPTLTVRTRREADKIVVEVGDNGPGIPDAIKDKILQPFFTTKKGTQGTGLGLSITHDIVKAHGGEMNIETSADGGATFIIGLPA